MAQEIIQGVLTEEEVMKLLGTDKGKLRIMRIRNGLPSVKINYRKRVYLQKDLMEYFEKNRDL